MACSVGSAGGDSGAGNTGATARGVGGLEAQPASSAKAANTPALQILLTDPDIMTLILDIPHNTLPGLEFCLQIKESQVAREMRFTELAGMGDKKAGNGRRGA